MYRSGSTFVDPGGSYACVNAGRIWQSSVPFSQFCHYLENSLKKQSWKNILYFVKGAEIKNFHQGYYWWTVGRDVKLLNHFPKTCLEFNKAPAGEGGQNWLPKTGKKWNLLGILLRSLNRWISINIRGIEYQCFVNNLGIKLSERCFMWS